MSSNDTRTMNDNISGSRRRFTRALGLAAAALALPAGSAIASGFRGRRLEVVRHSTFVMGQIANATLLCEEPAAARRAVTALFEEYRRLERLLSVFDPASDVSRINAAAGRDVVAVSADTLSVIGRALDVARATSGAFDITVEPLERLWGFRETTRSARPDAGEIAAALDSVGVEKIRIEGNRIGLTVAGSAIDLGGIAVGYALDRGAAILRRAGIPAALIEISGDYYAIGAPPGIGEGWEIGVVDPRDTDRIYRTAFIRDQGLSTSGNYENTVVYDACSYGHIFDPERGVPAGRLLSVTVTAPTSLEADAYSTALFVHGDPGILPAGASSILVRG